MTLFPGASIFLMPIEGARIGMLALVLMLLEGSGRGSYATVSELDE